MHPRGPFLPPFLTDLEMTRVPTRDMVGRGGESTFGCMPSLSSLLQRRRIYCIKIGLVPFRCLILDSDPQGNNEDEFTSIPLTAT